MPLPVAGQSKDEFIPKCMAHYINKGKDKDQAYAICISEWENQLSENKYSVMFDKTIPNYVIESFVKDGYKVHIFGGNELFNPTKPAFKLAKQSGVSHYFVHFGDLEHILDNNGISMFITTDDKWSHLEQFNKYVGETAMPFEEGTVRIMEERWVTRPDETKGGESCPICVTLQEMSWVERGAPVNYNWPGGSKKLDNGLPAYRLAHSSIGEGRWRVGDSVCKCYKEFRNSFKTIQLSSKPREVHFHTIDCKCNE